MQVWMDLFYFTQIIPVVPKLEWNCFNCPNSTEAVGIYPNVSDGIQISVKNLYITQIRMKLFEVAENWIKLCEVTQFWMKKFHLAQNCHFLKVDLMCWNFLKFFQFMEIFLISRKLGWSCFDLLRFNWGCWNLPKWF